MLVRDKGVEPLRYFLPRDFKSRMSSNSINLTKYINLFRNMVRMSTIRHRRVALMVVDWDTFVIHMLYFPHKFVGSLRKDQTHLATICFGTLFHHPIAHIGTWHNLLGLEPTSSSFGDWRFTN